MDLQKFKFLRRIMLVAIIFLFFSLVENLWSQRHIPLNFAKISTNIGLLVIATTIYTEILSDRLTLALRLIGLAALMPGIFSVLLHLNAR